MTSFDTTHTLFHRSARDMSVIEDGAVDLVVTSPPYPMIEMWDAILEQQDPRITEALQGNGDPAAAFEAMHRVLDPVWAECGRVLRDGGFACINIGDATRTCGNSFRLYTSHSRITRFWEEELGFHSLPPVLWRKQTNAPNKFMGSGMLPSGAYVTLEHEYILIFRKGEKRNFGGTSQAAATDRERRRRSAFFWEERNQWFSDLWDFKGTRQHLSGNEGPGRGRSRSGAFPLELPFRLIHMYSLQEDTILDPFAGTGTTLLAAAAAGRNSIGVEIDPTLIASFQDTLLHAVDPLNSRQRERITDHKAFVDQYRTERGYQFKHHNSTLAMPVMTSQETELILPGIVEVETTVENQAAPVIRVHHGDIRDIAVTDISSREGQLDLGLG